jgi:hypothetical protein
MMVTERYPNLKEEVGGPIPGCEISSILMENLSSGQLRTSCALAMACRPYISRRRKRIEKITWKTFRD